ncbi:MFS transporter [Rhodovarius crocodyli]|uniref:MFS transporter n=1 Tax=Rhodovarius crocodyli TaxID=1979269 RepID=A0A437MGW5_9PROT|nr:MFS transporter [Rhodovarius crocodyli]RVT96900.1 MFS transporter [Rhodovarius crocodyli]
MNGPAARIGLMVFAAGLTTTLPLPLYVEYAGDAGKGALAAAFACYAGVLILTAPLLGPLPDRIGRRRCMVLGLLACAVSSLLLAIWPGLGSLALARVFQGLGMGCVANAAGAWAAELLERQGTAPEDASRQGAAVVAAGTSGSFGLGSVLTLLALMAWPAMRPPVTLPLHLLLFVLCIALALALPETRRGPPGPALRWPAFPRGTLASSLGMVPAWGLTGVAITTIPAALAAAGQPRAGAWAVSLMILTGLLAQGRTRRLPPGRALRLGMPLLVLGGGVMFWGAQGGGLLPLMLGAVIIGLAAHGLVYLGGLAAATIAAPDDRPRATAGFFLIAHVGFSAVPLLVGIGADLLGTGTALALMWAGVLISTAVLWRALP